MNFSDNVNTGAFQMKSNEQYAEHIKREGIRLSLKFNLPPLSGSSDKQIGFGEDSRTKFVLKFEKMQQSLSSAVLADIQQNWLSHTDARFWIDNKNAYKTYFVKALEQIPLPGVSVPSVAVADLPSHSGIISYQKLPDMVIIDDSNDEKVTVTFPANMDLSGLLNSAGFCKVSDSEYFLKSGYADVERTGVVERLLVRIPQMEYPLKYIKHTAPTRPHDGYLFVDDSGKLAVKCMTAAVYRAASHIGYQVVYLDSADKSALKEFLKAYDVDVPESVKALSGVLND